MCAGVCSNLVFPNTVADLFMISSNQQTVDETSHIYCRPLTKDPCAVPFAYAGSVSGTKGREWRLYDEACAWEKHGEL